MDVDEAVKGLKAEDGACFRMTLSKMWQFSKPNSGDSGSPA